MKRPRVLLADDHQMLREAFAGLLEPSCDVVGKVPDGWALLSAAEQLEPDLALVDIAMPRLNGLDAARQLKQKKPGIKIIFLTVSEDADLAAEAIRVGASGYLLKNSAASELLQAVEESMQGRTYITPLIAKALVESLAQGEHLKRSKHTSLRQREVLQLLAEGHTMKQIARVLHIKPRTVAFHKYGMMKQLGVKSTAELVKIAVKMGVSSN